MHAVWQIAQRDYKFGKGKFKSLTKATYDAIGDHFRSLWGKEAGWAHSVLFTADLRAFSTQLSTKAEIKEEDSSILISETITKVEATPTEAIKREFKEEEKTVLEVEEYHLSGRLKRRKPAK